MRKETGRERHIQILSDLGMGIETQFYQGPGSTFFKTRISLTFGLIDTTIESRHSFIMFLVP